MDDETENLRPPKVREESVEERSTRKRSALNPSNTWIQAAGMLGLSEAEAEAWRLGEAWRNAQTEA